MLKVLVFKETLLPLSETFIQGQVASLKSFRAVLAGLERTHPSLPVGDDAILLSERGPILSDLRAKVYRRIGIAPSFHKKARKFHPDLIHAHFASGGRSALPLARALAVPLVVTLHGADITTDEGRGRYAAVGRQAALILCVSEFIRERTIQAGLPAEKLRVHYIGIDLDLFRPSPGAERGRHVLFVGRLVEKKGCEYAIRAMQQVQAVYPGCELRIVGDGPLRRRLERLAKRLEVNCRFLGFQSASVVREEMQRARLFCVPSVVAANGDSEGLGTVFFEAQAMGLPVVTSNHAGMGEAVLDGVTGLLSPERDDKGLAQSILRLLKDDELWERYHHAALEFVAERFDLKRQTGLLEDIYRGVVHAGRVEAEHIERLSGSAKE
jgi:glycosyltransferase involved in cell wall biosynthesis